MKTDKIKNCWRSCEGVAMALILIVCGGVLGYQGAYQNLNEQMKLDMKGMADAHARQVSKLDRRIATLTNRTSKSAVSAAHAAKEASEAANRSAFIAEKISEEPATRGTQNAIN